MISELVFTALFINGLHLVTRKDMLLGFVQDLFEKAGNPLWSNPVTECVTCMASLWGVLYLIGAGACGNTHNAVECILFIPALSAMSTIVYAFVGSDE